VTAELRGEGVDLSHKQAHALAGRWYRWKTDRHGEDPGSPQKWSDEIAGLIASIAELGEVARKDKAQPVVLKPISNLSDPSLRFSDLLGQLTTTQGQVLDRVGVAAESAAFLARERLALDPDGGRRRFLSAVIDELLAANALLRRRAEGDYAPDARPQRFPEWPPSFRKFQAGPGSRPVRTHGALQGVGEGKRGADIGFNAEPLDIRLPGP